MNYTFGATLNGNFDDAVAQVTEALMAEGFGVMTDIDVAATLKKKIDRDIPPYRILGACNPSLASQALDADIEVGALLPCNVVVRQQEEGVNQVSFIDPDVMMGVASSAGLHTVATEVRARLVQVMNSL